MLGLPSVAILLLPACLLDVAFLTLDLSHPISIISADSLALTASPCWRVAGSCPTVVGLLPHWYYEKMHKSQTPTLS